MNYSLSVECIVRSLHMCSCPEISKGVIHVVKKDTFEKYKTKIDKDGDEYYTLNISDIENEAVEDFRMLLTYYDAELCTSMMNKANIDKYFKSIKLK